MDGEAFVTPLSLACIGDNLLPACCCSPPTSPCHVRALTMLASQEVQTGCACRSDLPRVIPVCRADS